jgi:hypothetical protein
MNRSLQKQIAQLYPKKNKSQQLKREQNNKLGQNHINQEHILSEKIQQQQKDRTPLMNALNYENYPVVERFNVKENKVSPRARKILIVIICTLLAGFMFSSFSYTMSDNIANKLSLDLFDENGNPGMLIVSIHAILFGILMYLILSGGGY